MFLSSQSYELAQIRQAELVEKAALQRLLRANKQQSCSVTNLVRQISFRLNHWIVTVSFTHNRRVSDETYRAPI